MFGFGRFRSARATFQKAARIGLVLAALLVALRLAAPHTHAKAHSAGSDSACSVCATVSAPVDTAAPAPAIAAPVAVAMLAPAAAVRAPRDSHRSLHDSRGPPATSQL